MLWVEFLLIGAALMWVTVILVPWRPWSTEERLESAPAQSAADLGDVVVLVPARNEAGVLPRSLSALREQGSGLTIVVIDDQSTDSTAEVVRGVAGDDIILVSGKVMPAGWTGKLWALEQAKPWLERPLTLLLDADVVLSPGLIATLKYKLKQQGGGLISLMVQLPTQSFWARLLSPAFVFFFKLLYPFRLANASTSRVAAAAGGCMLLETKVLKEIGAFHAFRNELIDDCALALRAKRRGFPTWIGLTRSAMSVRPQAGLSPIWNTVARTAFTQLHYSVWWLLLCTALMAVAFVAPPLALLTTSFWAKAAAMVALPAMMVSYLPILHFYKLPPYLALVLPIVGVLYLAMTWDSALRYWRGERSRWKGRAYVSTGGLCDDCREP
ncbi:MAG: glycosyltransferase [Gammaproteobacteria bacterium]